MSAAFLQELVDCVPNPHACGGTGGCSGATVELAMNFVARPEVLQKDNKWQTKKEKCWMNSMNIG